MTPDKSKTMDAAEKLMLDLMEKHPGASESSLLALFQNVAKGKTRSVASNCWPTAIFQRAADGPLSRMSAIGTSRTSHPLRRMSAIGCKTEITCGALMSTFGTKADMLNALTNVRFWVQSGQ